MANRNYIILEDKDGKEVLPVTDGNGVFVEGGTKKLENKLTEIDSKTTELNEQLEHKANQNEVTALKNKVDNFQTEQDLNPNKDVELTALRTNIFGDNFKNADNRVQAIEKSTLSINILTGVKQNYFYSKGSKIPLPNTEFGAIAYDVKNIDTVVINGTIQHFYDEYVLLDSNNVVLNYSTKDGTGIVVTSIDVTNADTLIVSTNNQYIDTVNAKAIKNNIKDKLDLMNFKTSTHTLNSFSNQNGYWNKVNNTFTPHTEYYFIEYDISLINKIHLKCKYSLYTNLYVLFDKNDNVIDRISFEQAITFDKEVDVSKGHKIGVTVGKNDINTLMVTFNGSSILSKVSNSTNYWTGKKIVWLGTSIPAGGLTGYFNDNAYPQRVGKILGSNVFNEAIGSSCIHCKNPNLISVNNPYGFINDFHKVSRCLTNSIEEMNWVINNYNSPIFTANKPSSPPDGATIRGYSWENKINKYKTENIDMWVFDHGFNDFGHSQYVDETRYSELGKKNLYTFQGAFDFIVEKIKAINPFVRIVIIGNYENQNRPEVAEYQEKVAERYSLPIFKQWEVYGWSQETIEPYGKWVVDSENSSLYNWVTTTEKQSAIPYLYLWLPDKVHPHTDKSGNTLRFMAEHNAQWIELNIKL